jgi:hypothetical protein
MGILDALHSVITNAKPTGHDGDDFLGGYGAMVVNRRAKELESGLSDTGEGGRR